MTIVSDTSKKGEGKIMGHYINRFQVFCVYVNNYLGLGPPHYTAWADVERE